MNGSRYCQGYNSFPVFINCTTSGLERRQPLEEAKPRVPKTAAFTECTSSLPQEVQSAAAWDDHFISEYLQLYGVFDHQSPSGTLASWLCLSAQIANPDLPVRLSLRSSAMTRLGRLSSDIRLVDNGARMYCEALSQLQMALWNSKRMWDGGTLLAAKLLLLYEASRNPSSTPLYYCLTLGRFLSLLQTPLKRGTLIFPASQR